MCVNADAGLLKPVFICVVQSYLCQQCCYTISSVTLRKLHIIKPASMMILSPIC